MKNPNQSAGKYGHYPYFFSIKIAIFSLLLTFVSASLHAQTIFTNCVDGQIYVKINNSDPTTIPLYDTSMNILSFDTTYQNLITTYDIQKIEKAFETTGYVQIDKIYKIKFNNFSLVNTIIDDFAGMAFVDFAEKVPLDVLFCTADGTFWTNPTDHDHLDAVDFCGAFGFYTGTPTARRIAVTDSEFDITHNDLDDQFALNPAPCLTNVWDVTDGDNNVAGPGTFDHGTHVAGIAGGETGNGSGVASLSMGVPLICIKVCDDNAGGAVTHGYAGIIYAMNNCADIINCSWGSTQYSQANNIIIQTAFSNNKIIVAAAGNDNNTQFHYPAAYANVLAVANTDNTDIKNPSSCFGSWVDVSAPGTDVFSTLPSAIYGANQLGDKTGTSMSAPLVSALCGLVWTSTGAIANGYTNQMVINCILNSADNINGANPAFAGLLGTGRINALQALQCAQNPGVQVAFTQDRQVVCEGGTVDFTDATIVGGGVITAYNWTFQGGTPATSNVANPTITYNNSGTFTTTLTVTIAGQPYTFTSVHNVVVMGAQNIYPVSPEYVCKGEQMQYIVDFGEALFNNVNGDINGTPIVNPGIVVHKMCFYFNTATVGNTVIHIDDVTADDLILMSPVTCTLNVDIPVKTLDCCSPNLIVNGDFTSGWTGFTTDQVQDCPWVQAPSHACVNNYFPAEVLQNKGNGMRNDGRAESCGGVCGSIGLNYNPFPWPTSQCCGSTGFFVNESSLIWGQGSISLDQDMNYNFSFYTTDGNNLTGGGVQPLQFRVQILDGANNVVYNAVPYIVPQFNNVNWNKYILDIPNNVIPATATNYSIRIEQFEYFQHFNFDFLLDEIHLFRYLPLDLTSNLPGNNLMGGSGIITANSPQTYASYAWAGPSGTPSGNTLTGVNVAGIYTCTATDAGGCTRSATIQMFDMCTMPLPTFVWDVTNLTATDVINNFNLGSNIVTTNSPIFIAGTFTIDQNISFVNCPYIFLDDDAQIILDNGTTLEIKGSSLQASCDNMWRWIYADDVTESIVIENSTIRDAEVGLRLDDGATIRCIGNTFIDNFGSILLVHAPSGYNQANANCTILRNTFTSTTNPLLIPHTGQSKSERGIVVFECHEAEIGELVSSSKNIFRNIYNGIHCVGGAATASEYIRILNNDYIDINDDPSGGAYPIDDILGNCYATPRGAGIYFEPNGGTAFSDNHKAHIEQMPDISFFDNCDKAVAGTRYSAKIMNAYTNDCLMGFMFSDADFQKYEIGDEFLSTPGSPSGNGSNYISNSHIGVEISGITKNGTYVNANGIWLQNNGVPFGASGQERWPVGIRVDQFTNATSNSFSITDNIISLYNRSATGIEASNMGDHVNCELNYVYMLTVDAGANCFFPCTNELNGVNVINCSNSLIKGNHILGISDLSAYLIRNANGIRFETSLDLKVECNHVNDMQYGFLVKGNCTTLNIFTSTYYTHSINRNTFDNHKHGMHFIESVATSPGTFGDIGTTKLDYNNFFSNTDASKPYTSGYEVFRTTGNTAYLNNLYSNNVGTAESWSTFGTASRYTPSTATATIGACSAPYNKVAEEVVIEEPAEDFDMVYALRVMGDSMLNPQYPAVSRYMFHRHLYKRLEADAQARIDYPFLEAFYADKHDSNLAKFHRIDQEISNMGNMNDSVSMAAQLSLLHSMNNDIVTTEVYEESEKKINAIYLAYKVMGWDSLSNEQRQFTEELAKSCIGFNGPSVYKARALWTNAEPTALYNDDQLCGPANKAAGQGKLLGINEVIAYPNPASDHFKIKYNFPDAQNLEVHLFDHAGRKVKMVACNGCAGEIEISLSGLATGVYTYKLSGSGIISQSGKINVIKQ